MNALSVYLGDVQIGILEKFEDEAETFTFSEAYIESHIDSRPILGQIFEDRFPRPIQVGGPLGWFSHLLPQGAMRRWRSRLLGIDEHDSFTLLAQLGENLPGAVVLTPTQPLWRRKNEVQRNQVAAAPPLFSFSLAGAQWKLSARSTGRGLTTNANVGGTEYIAKFHSPEYPELPRCEFATMNWACASGIVTPTCELRNVSDFDCVPEDLPVGNGEVYVCERFDRAHASRIHMEDFAQILDRPCGIDQYRGSYDEIARVLQWIAYDSLEEFLKLVVFSMICGNGDAHLKNFSVLYDGGRTSTLAPAYDLVATVAYLSSDQLALELGGVKNFKHVSLSRFDTFAPCLGWSREKLHHFIADFAAVTSDTWQQPETRSHFSKHQREKVDQHVSLMSKRLESL